jgi:hypothetical protein
MKKIKIGDEVFYGGITSGDRRKVIATNDKKKLFRIKNFAIDFLQEDFIWYKDSDCWVKEYDNEKARERKDGWRFCECED